MPGVGKHSLLFLHYTANFYHELPIPLCETTQRARAKDLYNLYRNKVDLPKGQH